MAMTKNCFLPVALALLVSGCGLVADDMKASFALAFGDHDVQLTRQQILDVPYPSIYLRVNDGPQVFWVLGYVEFSTDLQWVGADRSLLVTRNGRVVKSHFDGLPSLVAVRSDAPDPLAGALFSGTHAAHWQWQMDLMPGYHFGIKAVSRFSDLGPSTTDTPMGSVATRHIVEDVELPDLKRRYQNHYWLDASSHQVVHSIQSLGPDMPRVQITHLVQHRP